MTGSKIELWVYFHSKLHEVRSFPEEPEYVGPGLTLLGRFDYDPEKPSTQLLDWALHQLSLLDIPHRPQVVRNNHSSYLYWN